MPDPGKDTPRKGKVELALDRDLASLPETSQQSALAAVCRLVARRLDGGLPARDAVAAARELRMGMERLLAQGGSSGTGDVGDELRAKRQEREAAG
jgi:hypothetical protein